MHTLPLGALIFYNSSLDGVKYDETIDIATKVLFSISAALNLIEVIIFQFSPKGSELD